MRQPTLRPPGHPSTIWANVKAVRALTSRLVLMALLAGAPELVHADQLTSEQAEGERGYANVPEGQVKIRVRVAPSGEALRTEVLESGFVDEQMEPCLREALEHQRWPSNKTGNSHYIDVIYWVSLGMQKGAGSEAMVTHLRREQISAGRRAKTCLQGRVDAGRYEIHGLNLVDREGATMAKARAWALPSCASGWARFDRKKRALRARSVAVTCQPRHEFAIPYSAMVGARVGTVGVDGGRGATGLTARRGAL